MHEMRQKYLEDPKKFKQILWDYTLSPKDFFDILDKKQNDGWLTEDWAIGRVLQHAPYYDAIALVPLSTIRERWEQVKPKIFNKEIRRGYDYILRRHALSAAG